MFKELIDVPKAGEHLVSFTDGLLEHKEPFVSTALSLPPLDMTPTHLEHAQTILALAPRFSNFRFETCPRRCCDEKFWSAYFTLLASEVRYREVTSRSRASSEETTGRPSTEARSSQGGEQQPQQQGGWFDGLVGLLEDLDRALAEDESDGTPSKKKPARSSTSSVLPEGSEVLSRCLEDQGCPFPSTFFVSETTRVSASLPASKNNSPAKPVRMAEAAGGDLDETSGDQQQQRVTSQVTAAGSVELHRLQGVETVSSLRLVPWWSQHPERGEQHQHPPTTGGDTEENDSFEWYC